MKFRMKAGEIAGLIVLGITAVVGIGIVLAGAVLLHIFFGGF